MIKNVFGRLVVSSFDWIEQMMPAIWEHTLALTPIYSLHVEHLNA